MSELPKIDVSGPADTLSQQTDSTAQVDKSIPEPIIGHPPASEHTTVAAEEAPAEKSKETEKPEDLARSLLKGFQTKIAGVFPKKVEKSSEPKDPKKEEPSENLEEKKEDVKEVKERRSASRKRNSLFGNFGLGRKDEKPTTDEIAPAESGNVSTSQPIKNTESASEPAPNPETPTATESTPERPGPTKRSSLFDSFRNQFVKKEKAEASCSVTKEPEITSTAAPVIPAVGSPEPEKDSQKSEIVPDKANAAQASNEPKVEKLSSKAEKRKSSLPFSLGLGKKDKPATSRDEDTTEKPLSPFAKLRATVKSKTSPKVSIDKNDGTTVHSPINETVNENKPDKALESNSSQPIVTEPEPTVQASVPEVAASA